MQMKDVEKIINSDDAIDVYYGDKKVWIENINKRHKTAEVRYLDDNTTDKVSVTELKLDNSLIGEISNFIKSNNYGVLATNYDCFPLSSPVFYYVNEKNEIFIPSVGGNKFKNLNLNNNVCLLINTEYKDFTKIKGVQIFGKANVFDNASEYYKECINNMDIPKIYNYDNIKVIKILPVKMIYLNSLASGERVKYNVEYK